MSQCTAESAKGADKNAWVLKQKKMEKKRSRKKRKPVAPEIPHTRHKLPAPLLLGEAKVCHLQAGHRPIITRLQLAVQQQVVRLQIKVDNAHLVQVG